ncbi:hypothetical protein RJ55_05026 [Drechmeria coniospora]|nr:hypothetical protein RJ55_05026 [Drechmeria coniospora]
MSAPYWGQLPEPKVVGQRSQLPGDHHPFPPHDNDDDSYSLPLDPRTGTHHASVQTTATNSTFGPHSPVDVFVGQGLAPRPADFQRVMVDGAAVVSENQQARMSHPNNDPLCSSALPPAPSDEPRGPPISYFSLPRSSYNGSDAHPTPSFRPAQPQQVDWHTFQGDYIMEPDGHYTTRPGYYSAGDATAPRDGHHAHASQPRRPSADTTERRRNMTKEEKRARVQAAEQRARQRIAAKAEPLPRSQPPTARDQHQAGKKRADTPPGLQHQRPREKRPEEQQEHSGRYRVEPQHGGASSSRALADANSGIPKRNLSFRERAARTEATSPRNETQSSSAIDNGPIVPRKETNKLRKQPTADPRHQQTSADGGALRHSKRDPVDSSRIPAKAIPLSVRNKQFPAVPTSPIADPHLVHVQGANLAGGPSWAPQPTKIRRRATEPGEHVPKSPDDKAVARQVIDPTQAPRVIRDVGASRRFASHDSLSESSDHGSHIAYRKMPGAGLYKPPQWLDEWKRGTTGTLAGALLELDHTQLSTIDKDKPWWEVDGRARSNSYTSRQRKAEAFDGEYDDSSAPTRFKPALHLSCGPLLRYCGIRRERVPARTRGLVDREIWRGSIMIVTSDAESSYDIAPIVRLFVQEIELLPPPPEQVDGELPPEYVDPVAGHPKLGRTGETLYVRPVELLEEAKDLSRDESDTGLFESSMSPPDIPSAVGVTDPPGSFGHRKKAIDVDGEKVQKYKDVRGFRLHAERGCTFWRFNIEVELRDKQQRIAYRVNRGPCMGFWVPPRGEAMNVMFHACNGFSLGAEPDNLSGPDPLWRDVLNSHQTKPFHAMVGGGDQIYNDCVADECALFGQWLDIQDLTQKRDAAFSAEMQDEMEAFFLQRYCMWFSQGLFGLANSQIPMVNMHGGHDIFQGYGSYPHHDMMSPVFRGLGAVAFKYYMLFQHQSLVSETEGSEPSWILGSQPGPYINELSRSVFVSMGGKMALLAVDCRTERTEKEVIADRTWDDVMNRMYAEVKRGEVEHLLVLLGVPMAYPRLARPEKASTSKFMSSVKAAVFGKPPNDTNDRVDVQHDLNDHWTGKNHMDERNIVMEDLQDLAIDKSVRITILSGDVHLAALGQFYSNPKMGLAKHKDPRYMLNIISSAMSDMPPSDATADALNKRNKVYHFDKKTDESMVPLFQDGVDGKSRSNKHLLPHRSWCSIRAWSPGSTPSPSPAQSVHERKPSPPPTGGGLLRRFSSKKQSKGDRVDGGRETVRGDRPPVSGGMGLLRRFSRRKSADDEGPKELMRTKSLGSGEGAQRDTIGLGRRGSEGRRADGGIAGRWPEERDEEEYAGRPSHALVAAHLSDSRGGLVQDEYAEGDESYFTARPTRRSQTMGSESAAAAEADDPMRRPFHRTPTGLSTKQLRKVEQFQVDLEGGLDITLNVEVNAKDPAGITVPYRLLVPRLLYEYERAEEEEEEQEEEVEEAASKMGTASKTGPASDLQREPSGFQKLFSPKKKAAKFTRVQEDYATSVEDEEEVRRT